MLAKLPLTRTAFACQQRRVAVIPAAIKHVPSHQKQSTSGSLPQASAVLSASGMAALASLLTTSPAAAALSPENPFAGVQSNSLYVTMALFLMCVPGMYWPIKLTDAHAGWPCLVACTLLQEGWLRMLSMALIDINCRYLVSGEACATSSQEAADV